MKLGSIDDVTSVGEKIKILSTCHDGRKRLGFDAALMLILPASPI
jgi:hypothetical protein